MSEEHPIDPQIIPPKRKRLILNTAIVILAGVVGYLSYTYMARSSSPQPASRSQSETRSARILQMDVLNGCGVRGAGAKITGVLRQSGFDVVEMKNYKTFNVPQSLVVDRVGDLAAARRVAAALGISEKQIVQQINPDYFVDVSVIIGSDFNSLRMGHQ